MHPGSDKRSLSLLIITVITIFPDNDEVEQKNSQNLPGFSQLRESVIVFRRGSALPERTIVDDNDKGRPVRIAARKIPGVSTVIEWAVPMATTVGQDFLPPAQMQAHKLLFGLVLHVPEQPVHL